MKNAGNKRLMLLLLALAMLICGVMGSTFATQVNKSDGQDNRYVDNNDNGLDYQIDLTYHTLDNAIQHSFLTATPFASAPWCPGYTKVVYLSIKNNEDFPVECTLTINADNKKLGQVMAYAVIKNPAASYSNWGAFKEASLSKGYLADENPTVFNIPATAPLTAGGAEEYALAIHMDETASNTYQDETMNMTFKLEINADYASGTKFDAKGNIIPQ